MTEIFQLLFQVGNIVLFVLVAVFLVYAVRAMSVYIKAHTAYEAKERPTAEKKGGR